jgi:hypothetical protein
VHLQDAIRPNTETPGGFLYADPVDIIVGEIAAAARRCCFSCVYVCVWGGNEIMGSKSRRELQ